MTINDGTSNTSDEPVSTLTGSYDKALRKRRQQRAAGKGSGKGASKQQQTSSSSKHREDNQRMGCDAMLTLSQMRPDFFRGPGGPGNPYDPWQYDPKPAAPLRR